MKHVRAAFSGNSHAGTYAAVLLLGIVGWIFLGNIPTFAVMMSKRLFVSDVSVLQENLSPNSYVALMMSPFVIGLLLFFLLVKLMHKRGVCSVLNGREKLRWGHFFTAFGLYTLLMVVFYLLLFCFDGDNFVLQFDAKAFFCMLPLLLVLVPLQTLFEEFLFRGYLTQAFSVWTGRVWLVWLLPALLFALAHAANPEVGAYGFCMMMSQYLLLALLFGLFTLADDGLEVSWGMHTANNLFLLLFFTEENSALPTAAVWRFKDATPSFWDPLEIALFGVVLWLVFRRVYHWRWPDMRMRITPNNMEKSI